MPPGAARGVGAMGRGEIGTSSAQLQTVHVLKDITDRREAERRYRELFDNIQEGIYVSTPQGRFVEVNDALVRILGYSSRDEVFSSTFPPRSIFLRERRRRTRGTAQAQGEMHNHEEILRRKDGSPVHVFMNCLPCAMRPATSCSTGA
jgi:two-component system, NtrC family, sensor kinase